MSMRFIWQKLHEKVSGFGCYWQKELGSKNKQTWTTTLANQ